MNPSSFRQTDTHTHTWNAAIGHIDTCILAPAQHGTLNFIIKFCSIVFGNIEMLPHISRNKKCHLRWDMTRKKSYSNGALGDKNSHSHNIKRDWAITREKEMKRKERIDEIVFPSPEVTIKKHWFEYVKDHRNVAEFSECVSR